ncbi:hypothetical protein HDU98_011585 [Podochytrium sp. JEL0797]|nr:hypothetical protein HDU98_011585 [Podochytrium sp. JEL0797]
MNLPLSYFRICHRSIHLEYLLTSKKNRKSPSRTHLSRQILRSSAKRFTTAATSAAPPATPSPIVDPSAVAQIVSSVAQRHGLQESTAAFPSLSIKFKVVTESISECNAKLFGNVELNQIKTPSDLACVLSSTGFAAPKSLLEQSYNAFNKKDTVEELFIQMEAQGTRPANLYFQK